MEIHNLTVGQLIEILNKFDKDINAETVFAYYDCILVATDPKLLDG